MATLAGIDLLGKFRAGCDSQGNVGKRFLDFIQEYFNVNQKEADIIYELRNSLLHSFGLHSRKYKFILLESKYKKFIETITIKSAPGMLAKINVWKLYKKFIKAISKYYNALKKHKLLRENFNDMYTYYGISRHGPLKKIQKFFM